MPLSDPVYDYKGEHSLKYLDIPAYERRGSVVASMTEGPEEEAEVPPGKIRRMHKEDLEGRTERIRKDNTDTPAFLRKMMD